MSDEQTASQPDLGKIWSQVIDTMKQRVVMPALWRAMEGGQPIALQDGTFVVGYDVEKAYDSHLIMDTRFKNIIEQSLTSITGEATTVRVIQGTTQEEWRQLQEEEREKQRLVAQREKKEPVASDSGWDALSEQLIRRFAALPSRQLPAVQAEFLTGAVEEIARAYPRLMPGDPPDDVHLRTYSKLLDRISDRTGIPATTLGFFVIQCRTQEERGKKGG